MTNEEQIKERLIAQLQEQIDLLQNIIATLKGPGAPVDMTEYHELIVSSSDPFDLISEK